MMKTLSAGPLGPPMRISALQDSLIDIIEAPFFPIMHPIFPGGTSRTERISSSGPFPSTFSSSGIGGRDGQSA
uniref:Uncharacterized protein n=1 Tax=Medicago truncatula TaxID=3880 RepID=B7FFK9_MEDTR|nr:unknown [Medicago truncatula]